MAEDWLFRALDISISHLQWLWTLCFSLIISLHSCAKLGFWVTLKIYNEASITLLSIANQSW